MQYNVVHVNPQLVLIPTAIFIPLPSSISHLSSYTIAHLHTCTLQIIPKMNQLHCLLANLRYPILLHPLPSASPTSNITNPMQKLRSKSNITSIPHPLPSKTKSNQIKSNQPLPSQLHLPRCLSGFKSSFRYADCVSVCELEFFLVGWVRAGTVVWEGDAGEGSWAEVGRTVRSIVIILIPLRIARDVLWLTLMLLLLTVEHLFEELKLCGYAYDQEEK